MASSLHIRGTIPAMLVFADIMDSSKYSSVLGYQEYARRLLGFQHTFERLAGAYFEKAVDPTVHFIESCARGDEGTVFIARADGDFTECLFTAIEFLYHLKARLKFGLRDVPLSSRLAVATSECSPQRIGVGAGIHIGRVAYAVDKTNPRSEIARLEGFSINYAKRVESCSRLGTYSRVFLSQEAARLLEDKPAVLSAMRAPLKGIGEATDVYEVQSGFFEKMRLDENDAEDGLVIESVKRLSQAPTLIDEPWLKALIVSVLRKLREAAVVKESEGEYDSLLSRVAWHSSVEDDPILLDVRAAECQRRRQVTHELRYLRQIVRDRPDSCMLARSSRMHVGVLPV